MAYEIINVLQYTTIKKTDVDGTEWFIPFDEGNADYQQYLVDTDGGLPLPKETK